MTWEQYKAALELFISKVSQAKSYLDEMEPGKGMVFIHGFTIQLHVRKEVGRYYGTLIASNGKEIYQTIKSTPRIILNDIETELGKYHEDQYIKNICDEAHNEIRKSANVLKSFNKFMQKYLHEPVRVDHFRSIPIEDSRLILYYKGVEIIRMNRSVLYGHGLERDILTRIHQLGLR